MDIKKFTDYLFESNDKHEYGCVMMQFDIPNWNTYLKEIKKEDIYDLPNYGLETEPHVTLMFGVYLAVNPDDVKKVVENVEQPYVIFRNISTFSNQQYDVVKLDAECEALHCINDSLKCMLPNYQSYPEYHPHMTLSYVKSGRGIYYIKTLEKPLILKPTKINYSYSDNKGNKKKDLIVW